jgi:hypothetical protein
VVPGDLANLGGVHVSNLEGVQNLYQSEVSSEAARRSLSSTMRSGWRRAMTIADDRKLSERAAIELAAVDAMMKRSLQLPDAPRSSLEARVLPKTARRVALSGRTPRTARTTTTRTARTARSAMLRQLRTSTRSRTSRRASGRTTSKPVARMVRTRTSTGRRVNGVGR